MSVWSAFYAISAVCGSFGRRAGAGAAVSAAGAGGGGGDSDAQEAATIAAAARTDRLINPRHPFTSTDVPPYLGVISQIRCNRSIRLKANALQARNGRLGSVGGPTA